MTMPEVIRSKVLTPEGLIHKLSYWRFFGKKIVFTNGCFDILHLGHVDYLSRAASLGDVLLIGVNSDASTRRLKGEGRPINGEEQRQMLLASLFFVDYVILFEDDTPYELIKTVQPDVLVKGGDYNPDTIVGADVVRAKGGLVTTIGLLTGYSTTFVEKKIKNSPPL